MSTTPDYARRAWVAWLLIFGVVGMLVAKAYGLLPETPVAEAAALPTSAVTPTVSADSALSLSSLNGCGQPDRVGVFRSDDAFCHPVFVWTLAEFAQKLLPLNVLAPDETLYAPSVVAESRCPFIILRGAAAAGARLCFTPQGGVYRNAGGARDGEWSWRLNIHSQWTLDKPLVVARAGN